MKKIGISLSLITLIITLAVLQKVSKKQNHQTTKLIAILQTASHPALDAAREGFIQILKKEMGDSVDFVIKNAQGSVSQAYALAQQFHARKDFTLFYAIATPAAQALAALEKERPIVIAAVTDPHALELIHPTTNVCGVQDMIDTAQAVEFIMNIVPSAKTIGLIYTSGEINSQALITKMHETLAKKGIAYLDCAFSNETDIAPVIDYACRKSDLLFAPTDNTVASAIICIATSALKAHKPLIVSDTMLIKHGPLAGQGINYAQSGKHAGAIAYDVIKGKKPSELPIERSSSIDVIINQATAQALGISIPASLKNAITTTIINGED